MPAILVNSILVLIAIVTQAAGASLLPATRGFTAPWPTLAVIVSYMIGLICMARLMQGGMNLSVVIPIMTATIPLAILAVAFLVYHEPASLLRIALLLTATIIIAIASAIG